jgi:uncharacterized membrane protein
VNERPGVPSAPPKAVRRSSVHTSLVLAPAACWTAAPILDLASRFGSDPDSLVRIATWSTGLGLVGAVVAGIAGMIAAAPIPAGSAAHRRVLVHLGAAMAVTVLVAFGLIVRSAVQGGGPAAPTTLAISATGVLLLVAPAATGAGGPPGAGPARCAGGGRRPDGAGPVIPVELPLSQPPSLGRC